VSALNPASTGINNVSIGAYSLIANTSGAYNSALGKGALTSNTTGNENVAAGNSALYTNTTGLMNVAVGSYALYQNSTGNYNTVLGSSAGLGDGSTLNQKSTVDIGATLLGYQASRDGVSNSTSLSNITAIGYLAKVTKSNSLILGGTGANVVSVGIGNTAPDASAVLDITSTTKGSLLPRMTTAQKTAIATPATGLIVYDTDLNQLQVYNGTAWGGYLVRDVTDEYAATASQTAFTLTQTPSVNSKVKMYINGIRISNTAFSKTGSALTYVPANNGAYALVAGDRIQMDYYY